MYATTEDSTRICINRYELGRFWVDFHSQKRVTHSNTHECCLHRVKTSVPCLFSSHSPSPSQTPLIDASSRLRIRKFPLPVTTTLPMNSKKTDDPILWVYFKGPYRQWYLTESEAEGVTQYSIFLSVMPATAKFASLLAIKNGHSTPSTVQDAVYTIVTGIFGFSLQKIHINARPLHTLRAPWTIAGGGAISMLFFP